MTNLKIVQQTESVLCNDDIATLNEFRNIAASNPRVSINKYHYIDSELLAKSVNGFLENRGFETSVQLLTGAGKSSTKHIIEFTLHNFELFGGKDNTDGDGSAAKILIINSYNGEASMTVMAGIIRFACANGIISGQKQYFEKVRHLAGDMILNRLDNLNETIEGALAWLKDTFVTKVNDMKEVKLDYIQESRLVFKLDLPASIAYEVLKRRHPDYMASEKTRIADKPRNSWTLFNVINEVIREKSRHSMNEVEHNISLMNDVIELSKVA